MTQVSNKIKAELEELIDRGYKLYYGLSYQYASEDVKKKIGKEKVDFVTNYEQWYSEARQVITILLPDRTRDLDAYYKQEKRKEIDFATYTISDALLGLVTRYAGEVKADAQAAIPKMLGQVQILESCKKAIDGLLFNLRTVLQADRFDSDIEQARVLNKNGYHRAAGALAGVVLEAHLKELVNKKSISVAKKNPTIADFNNALKDASVFEIKDWRFIQHLADIRNLCDHKKTKEPGEFDIVDLIVGVDKVIKTIG